MATTFNLETQINLWKSQLSANEQFNQDNIAELESHLYDEMEQLRQYNLDEEEAYYIAQKRLGNIQDLKQEYAKVNTVQSIYKKMLPYINGVLICFFLSSLLEFTIYLSVHISPNFLQNWGLLSHVLSNFVLVILCGGLVFFILKKMNWKISTYLLLASILFLQLISDFILVPGYVLCPGKYPSPSEDWLKYYSNIQNVLLLTFFLLSGIIYYKNRKADRIQFVD